MNKVGLQRYQLKRGAWYKYEQAVGAANWYKNKFDIKFYIHTMGQGIQYDVLEFDTLVACRTLSYTRILKTPQHAQQLGRCLRTHAFVTPTDDKRQGPTFAHPENAIGENRRRFS